MKTIIFDMDGTLVDSMKCWRGLLRDYLLQNGISVSAEIQNQTVVMSLEGSLTFVKKYYQLEDSVASIKEKLDTIVRTFYDREVKLKPYAIEALESAQKKGYQLALGTSTDIEYVRICLEKNHLKHYFQKIFTTNEMNLLKDDPKFFLDICKDMDAKPWESLVVDDSVFALRAARKAGLQTVGMLDIYSQETWDQIRAENMNVIDNLSELHL